MFEAKRLSQSPHHANTLRAVVAERAREQASGVAFVTDDRELTWSAYELGARSVAATLATRHPRGERIAIQLADGPDVHTMMLAAELAGLVGVGIGPRAGSREVDHLLAKTGAAAVYRSLPESGDAIDDSRALDAQELWFLNSTSGTTGLPKCVMHNQARWFAFHGLADRAAEFRSDDVFMSLLPAPFGFGLWTAHFTPALVGVPCVLLDAFTPDAALAAIERHRVTVLAAVSTQFMMMLNAASFERRDLASLRVMFTGGEMVPYERALEWEQRTGSLVLQFYGSNETGALSGTKLSDDQETRLRTAGHVIPELEVRLFDPDSDADVTATGGPGVAACRGAVNCLGYYDDPAANAQLFTADGWMRTGDLCTIDPPGDPDGVLTVAGRASDFIIRGGKNISAAFVETECATMPGVLLAAAVAKPAAVFGERVCVFCAVASGISFTLDDLRAHLAQRGIGKENWPEYLVRVSGDLPRSSGAKVAKGELREQARALESLA